MAPPETRDTKAMVKKMIEELASIVKDHLGAHTGTNGTSSKVTEEFIKYVTSFANTNKSLEKKQQDLVNLIKDLTGQHYLELPIDKLAPSFWKHHDSGNEYKTWIVTRDCNVRLTDDEKNFNPDDSV
ncbi:hypothetical protein KCU98_g2014, partial [Aureobasidium melanogenum]